MCSARISSALPSLVLRRERWTQRDPRGRRRQAQLGPSRPPGCHPDESPDPHPARPAGGWQALVARTPTPGLEALRAAQTILAWAALALLWPALLLAASYLQVLPWELHQTGGPPWVATALLLSPALPLLHAARVLARSTLGQQRRGHHQSLVAAALFGGLAIAALSVSFTSLRSPLRLTALAAAGVWSLTLSLGYALLSRTLDDILDDAGAKRQFGWSAAAMTTTAALTGAAVAASGEDPSSIFFFATIAGPLGLIGANAGLRRALRVTPEERELRDAVEALQGTGLTLLEDRMPLQIRLDLPFDLPSGLCQPALDPSPQRLHAHPHTTLSTQGLTLRLTLPELLALAAGDGVSLREALESRVQGAIRLRAAMFKAVS